MTIGDQIRGIDFILDEDSSPEEYFAVRGWVRNVELSKDGDSITVPFRGGRMSVPVDENGGFEVHLPRGSYELSYQPARAGRSSNRIETLGAIQVDRDSEGLVLRPQARTTLQAKLLFVGGVPEGAIDLSLQDLSQSVQHRFSAAPPRFEFGRPNLPAGDYTVTILDEFPGNQFFVSEIRVNGKAVGSRQVRLDRGRAFELEIVLSADFATIVGSIRGGGPHYYVGLRGAEVVQVAQADQDGRFRFARVAPGAYSIAAWPDRTPSEIQSSEAWTSAGASVREFHVDAGATVELQFSPVPR